jgi:DNA-binding winged helix-turn-helix (wHTH) protein
VLEEEGTRYIETVPKRGYRFIAAELDTAVAPTPSPTASENAIAVMPFTDIRSSPQAGYEALGNVLRVFPIAWQFRREHAIFQRGP